MTKKEGKEALTAEEFYHQQFPNVKNSNNHEFNTYHMIEFAHKFALLKVAEKDKEIEILTKGILDNFKKNLPEVAESRKTNTYTIKQVEEAFEAGRNHGSYPNDFTDWDSYSKSVSGETVPPEKEWIICSANWYDDGKEHTHGPKNVESGFVTCGRRHHNCITTFAQIVGFPYSESAQKLHNTEEQGFLTNLNRWVNRKEAYDIAFKADQIKGPNKGHSQNSIGLTSEDLY